MIFDKFDPTALQADAVRSTPTGTFSENYYASQKAANYNDGGQASSAILRDLWGPMVDQVNELTGSNFYSPADHLNVGVGISATAGNPEQMYRWRAKEFMDYVTEANTKSPGLIPKPILDLMSFEALNEKTITEAKLASADFAAIDQNSEGFMIGVAQFLGALSAGAVDPSNVPYLAFGGAGAKTLTWFALREALINGGSEAALQPAIAEWYNKVGLEYTSQNFINNVVGAALVGGALPIAGAGAKAIAGAGAGAVSRGIDINSGVTKPTRALIDFLDSSQPQLDRMLTPDQMISGVETLKSAGVKISREANTAITLAQDLQDIEASNPISGNPVGTIIDHASTMADAQRSLFNGEVPKIKAVPIEMVKPDAILQQADNLDGFVFRFNPNEIGVDAKTFQFKMGGDAFGVSERLRGVKVWDPILGGEILVYEYADGRMFVADGHQRLGLAKRITAEDPAQNVVIYGRKLREADGVTPEQAMVVAAIKNIAEGSGSAIDAAKVARIDPAGFSSLIGKTLPPSSVLVRQANDMINLTDNAFGAIINEVIPANYGAIIGRVLGDRKDLQDAAVKILAKSEPANVFQAEAIVRQVREADAEQVQQFSLFGEETVTESLFTERAKILDQAYRQLKQDKATFANLTRNADRIEAEGGNVLDRQLNEQKATQDAQTIALLQTLANRKGPVSDALSAAARAFRDTGSYGRPTRDFLESVRNAIATGDLDRISSSDIGRTLDGPSPGSADTVGKEPVLDGFEEPNGIAAEQQIDQLTQDMFGAPEAQAAPAQAQANVDAIFPLNAPAGKARTLVVAKDLTDLEMRNLQGQLKGRQPNDAMPYMEMATNNHNALNDAAEKITSDLGIDFRRAPLKKLEKIDIKLKNKGKAGEYSTISDAARTGITARSMSEADAFVAGLAKQFHLVDEGWIVTSAGYFDRKLMVVFDDGGVGEIQIWPPGMLAAKENPSKFGPSGHDMYDVWNNKSTSAEVRAKLEGQMKEVYAEVASKLDPSFAEKLGIGAPMAPSTPATLASGISSVRSPDNVSRASAAEPVQPDLGLQQSAASPSMAITSESLSTKNRMVPSYGETQFELTSAGQQALIPGVDVVTQQQIMQVAGSKPMRGGTAAMPEGGLFDQVSIMQRDLIDELQATDTISVGLVQDTNGNIVPQTMTMAEIKTMLDAEDKFIEQLGICGI
ncbi:hypothetical protein UFOVP847_28 [uncultured Caudovirales phage]|uniref:Uncharacterized protein n=1 Tax=uncultured Caudovirales phage TaxID=2100421 RepID=A0A6J5P3M1_9CAUD|nr:hypothetical protein UFOVP847_28 [uncultured Caudovirales phage]